MKQLLCVDDDPFMLELYALAISPKTATIVSASSAEEAMSKVADVAAIVLDVGLPGMSGREFLQWVRDRSDVPVLVVTGEEKPADIGALRELGATDVLTKPVELPALRAWVEFNVR